MNVLSRWGLAIALSVGLHVVVVVTLVLMGGSGTPPPPLPPATSGVAEHVDTPSLDDNEVGKDVAPVAADAGIKETAETKPLDVPKPPVTKKVDPPKKPEAKKPTPPKKPEAKKPETKPVEAPKKPEAKSADKPADKTAEKPADNAGAEWKSYEVQPGDSLTKLAKKCGCTVQELAKINGLKPTSNLILGQKIKIK